MLCLELLANRKRLGLILWCLYPVYSWAASAPESKELGRKEVFDLEFTLPFSEWQNEWGKNAEISFKSNLDHAAPFGAKEHVIINERFSNSRFPFMSVLKIIRRQPIAEFEAVPSAEDLRAKDMVLVSKEKKKRGSPGTIYHFKHIMGETTWIHKWMGVFGDNQQTCILIIYYDSTIAHFVRDQVVKSVQNAMMASTTVQKHDPLTAKN